MTTVKLLIANCISRHVDLGTNKAIENKRILKKNLVQAKGKAF